MQGEFGEAAERRADQGADKPPGWIAKLPLPNRRVVPADARSVTFRVYDRGTYRVALPDRGGADLPDAETDNGPCWISRSEVSYPRSLVLRPGRGDAAPGTL